MRFINRRFHGSNMISLNQIAGLDVGVLLTIGLFVLIGVVIIMVVGALIFFLPAAVIAGVVWFLTGNELYTGLAFLAIALLSLTRRK